MAKSDDKDNKIPVNRYGRDFSSQIRDIKIYLPVQDDKEENEDENNFVGRERVMERLYQWLVTPGKGSYLVTGFRGMGKSTIVRKVTDRLTKKTDSWVNAVLWTCIIITFALLPFLWWLSLVILVLGLGIYMFFKIKDKNKRNDRLKRKDKKKYKNESRRHLYFDEESLKRIKRERKPDNGKQSENRIKLEINLGHEVLHERDILSLIATNIKKEYGRYVKSLQPAWHFVITVVFVLIVGLCGSIICKQFVGSFKESKVEGYAAKRHNNLNSLENDTWINRRLYNANVYLKNVADSLSAAETKQDTTKSDCDTSAKKNVNSKKAEGDTIRCSAVNSFVSLVSIKGCKKHYVSLFILYSITTLLLWFFLRWLLGFIPWISTPRRVLKRLDSLNERIISETNIENGSNPTANSKMVSVSLFNRHRRKTIPIADVREIETELADIINTIRDPKECPRWYTADFIIVFDEMDKIDPAMMNPAKNNEMPEFTDSVKGFPDGMDSRERRRNVLKLLANIKLFLNTANAKFVFISGRELYDAYLADLSDRDFAISSIFTGVLNADSFLTPEGGQTDVRSMSEWYIANRLIPYTWLHERETTHRNTFDVLKIEKPSLKWYYEYLISECKNDNRDAAFVIGFLHTFAAYLTHISNGSPKKIYLYFEKYLRRAVDCIPMNDWGDVCVVGKEADESNRDKQKVLYFDAIQQRTINFVYYLANPIMGTITNDLSSYGDRFLVTLSFIIDHIYKHHSRSFSWRNLEQIPDLLKTSKAPELRDSVTSIMEYLTQIHVSNILIGLNEYKFHKSIAEEISVISKLSDEASAIFNFTLDESMSVIQHNTKMLNYYLELEKEDKSDEYDAIIARIHSNLGDLRYWDEDYYAAALEYRAAIDKLPKKESESEKSPQSNFLTRLRCMLKLGLTYEMRKLYPNAYQIYCHLIEEIIEKRWIDESKFGLFALDTYVDGWRGKRQTLVYPAPDGIIADKFGEQLNNPIYREEAIVRYMTNVDGVISTFSKSLTPETTKQINTLTLFEEIRYVYQAILAKLSILEKMGMSGITQTNIEVAEGEFNAIHKSVNIREKFIISADFFRKLAEILYYKNSLTILSQNQDSFYASVYYGDYDFLARLDDFCMYGEYPSKDGQTPSGNALKIKQDVKFFFNWLNNGVSESETSPKFSYVELKNCQKNPNKVPSLKELYKNLDDNLGLYLTKLYDETYFTSLYKTLPDKKEERKQVVDGIKSNIKAFLAYNINIPVNQSERFFFDSLDCCDYHRQAMRRDNLRPACYACKYYTRSLRILTENMFEDKSVLSNQKTKSLGILRQSFKNKLLYTNTNTIRTLAMTLEGFGNIMFSCASGNEYELGDYKTKYGINPEIITLLQDFPLDEKEAVKRIEDCENKIGGNKLSRLDKSILYFWDAYRFYIIDANYHEAVGCLKKISTIFTYYIQVLCYYSDSHENPLGWKNEIETIKLLVYGDGKRKPFLDELFALVARYTGYKYDHINLTEINELKWIYSKEQSDNIDLTKLSIYPDIRATWLRIAEIKAKGLRYLHKHDNKNYPKSLYLNHIISTYPLIAPKRRNETTFYEEVLAYYTKVRYNDHILNNILGGNPMVDHEKGGYAELFHIKFYEKLAKYLSSGKDVNRLDSMLFGTSCDVKDRLDLIEYLILDTLVCITNMVKVFTPHSHLTSYSKSFIAIVYNYYWEWARKFEFLYSLYQYQEATSEPENEVDNIHDDNPKYKKVYDDTIYNREKKSDKVFPLQRKDDTKAISIIDSIASGIRSNKSQEILKSQLRVAMSTCSSLISNITEKKELRLRYGLRSDRLYQRLRHEIDDITINTIFSNYTAEMALRYYQLSDEANTEGEAYTEMISSLHFLNDDLNNDTCQFNIACDRFLLNCGVVGSQRKRLEELYKVSKVYELQNAYIDGPNKISHTETRKSDFKRSDWINSELQ